MKRKKKEGKRPAVKLQVWMDLEMLNAAMQVAKWDHKTLSVYVRELILQDVRRRGALPAEERT